ncbi:helicase RepA family protein [Lachnospiraceae bacterium 29-91]
MANKKEMTTPSASNVHTELLSSPGPLAKEHRYADVDTEQPIQCTDNSITNHTVKSNRQILETVSMAELYDTVYPSKPPLIDGLLYTGVYLFAGAPKLGKSFLMAQLAYHISMGISLWNYPVRKATVLYLALEDDYRRLQERLYRMFGTEGTDNLFFSVSAGNLRNGLNEQLQEFIKKHIDTKLIIIDTLQKVREAGGDNYSYANDYEIITRLKEFADSNGICILLVHHTRKQGSEDKFDMISGTTGLLGAADGAFLLQKEKRTGNAATLEISGRDQQDQKLHLIRNMETLLWELEKAETELWKEPPEPLLEKIAKHITADFPLWNGTPTELMSLLGTDLQPNVLTKKLNVNAGRLLDEYGICYSRERCHAGRKVSLSFKSA